MHTLLAPTVNLLILVALLVYFTKDSIRDFFRSRHQRFDQEINAVKVALAKAKSDHEEALSKLRGAQAEIETMTRQGEREIVETRQKILADAQAAAAKIVSDARQTAEAMSQDFRRQLSAEFGTLVLERAEKLIKERLTQDDRKRMASEFTKQLGGQAG